MRLGPSAPRASGPWQNAQLATYTGAPRLAAAASGSGPSPRNSRTPWPDRAVADVLGGACADSTVGKHISSTTVSVSRAAAVRGVRSMALLRRPSAVDEDVGARDEA